MEQVNILKLKKTYDHLSHHVKNKKSLYLFNKNKMNYLYYLKYLIDSNSYKGGNYNIFMINYPKKRIIMSQNILDKTINHYLTEEVLIPKLSKYLDKRNVATRKMMGTSYGINLLISYLNKLKIKYNDLYVLKIDIKKYFPSISHEILLKMLKEDLDDDEYLLFEKIINSTDNDYINENIKIINDKNKVDLPFYKKGYGLPIGNLSSQFLAIFYLHKFHHFIINELKIKYFINYMDDYLLFHPSKEYLEGCMRRIIKFLDTYELAINKKKTNIYSLRKGVSFLGYKFIILKNKKLLIKLANNTKKNIKYNFKKSLYVYNHNHRDYMPLFNTLQNYKYSFKYVNSLKIDEIIKVIW